MIENAVNHIAENIIERVLADILYELHTIKSELSVLKTEVKEIKKNNTGLHTGVNKPETKCDSLRDRVSTLEDKSNKLHNDINELRRKSNMLHNDVNDLKEENTKLTKEIDEFSRAVTVANENAEIAIKNVAAVKRSLCGKRTELQTTRANALRALLVAHGGRMMLGDAMKLLGIDKFQFSRLLKVCDFIETKTSMTDKRKKYLILVDR